MKLKCSVFALSCSSSLLLRLRSSGFLALNLSGLLSLVRLALSSLLRLPVCLQRGNGQDCLLTSFLSVFSSSSSPSVSSWSISGLSVVSWASLSGSVKEGSDGQESLITNQLLWACGSEKGETRHDWSSTASAAPEPTEIWQRNREIMLTETQQKPHDNSLETAQNTPAVT